MELMFLNVMLAILIMICVPVLIGIEGCRLFKLEGGLAKSLLLGYIIMWAFFQIICVPLVLGKQSFSLLCILISIVYMGFVISGLYKCRGIRYCLNRDDERQKVTIEAWISLIIMFVLLLYVVIQNIRLQHNDEDDARFVVNAVDVYRTNRLLLTDVMTGNELTDWIGDLHKDVASPWAVFIAYLSKLTGIYPSVMAHTILPPVMILLAIDVYWLIADVFLKKDTLHKSVFVVCIIFLNINGYYSLYSASTFLLSRLWQGKAIVAGIGIPLIFLMFMWMYEMPPDKKVIYGLMTIVNISMCLFSNMGIIIGALMYGCFGLVYSITKRKLIILPKIMLCCIPNVLYIFISYVLK